MPDLIGNDLIFGVLLHKSDFLRLLALAEFIEKAAVKKYLAAPAPMRRKNGLQLPEQRTFPTPGGTAEDKELPRPDRQRKAGERIFFLLRVGKAQISDRKYLHSLSSFLSRITGVRTSIR